MSASLGNLRAAALAGEERHCGGDVASGAEERVGGGRQRESHRGELRHLLLRLVAALLLSLNLQQRRARAAAATLRLQPPRVAGRRPLPPIVARLLARLLSVLASSRARIMTAQSRR